MSAKSPRARQNSSSDIRFLGVRRVVRPRGVEQALLGVHPVFQGSLVRFLSLQAVDLARADDVACTDRLGVRRRTTKVGKRSGGRRGSPRGKAFRTEKGRKKKNKKKKNQAHFVVRHVGVESAVELAPDVFSLVGPPQDPVAPARSTLLLGRIIAVREVVIPECHEVCVLTSGPKKD